MPFGFARVSRGSLAAAPQEGAAADPGPGGEAPAANEHEPVATEFEHFHGDSCSRSLRGE